MRWFSHLSFSCNPLIIRCHRHRRRRQLVSHLVPFVVSFVPLLLFLSFRPLLFSLLLSVVSIFFDTLQNQCLPRCCRPSLFFLWPTILFLVVFCRLFFSFLPLPFSIWLCPRRCTMIFLQTCHPMLCVGLLFWQRSFLSLVRTTIELACSFCPVSSI